MKGKYKDGRVITYMHFQEGNYLQLSQVSKINSLKKKYLIIRIRKVIK